MKDVLILGAGNIGLTICALLRQAGDYRLTVADNNPASLAALLPAPTLRCTSVDIHDGAALRKLMTGHFAVINACPFPLTVAIAEAAAAARVHYLDLTEDRASTRRVALLAGHAEAAMIPQCGLAPGFISIVAYDLSRQFDSLDSVQLRVGALPKYPSNALKYNLTWSTEGLINEYCQPCEAIVDGQLSQVPALEEIEHFSLDGVAYEAFNTSGGLGTLCETLAGNVRNLNYRTVRYPGHRDAMKLLLQDLRLRDRPALLKDILETALPITYQDVVLIFVNVSGLRQGRLIQKSYANKLYSHKLNGQLCSAIQMATASSVCAVLDLLATGLLPQRGFVRQEDIALDAFLGNRFGCFYASSEDGDSQRPFSTGECAA